MTSYLSSRAHNARFLKVSICTSVYAIAFAFAGSTQAQAIPGENFSCDFATKIGQCKAISSPKADGGFHLFTDALRCAAVDYASNGRMRRLFMKEGRGVDDKAQSALQIASCTTYASKDIALANVTQVTAAPVQQGAALWQAPVNSNVVVQAQRVQQPATTTTVSRMTKSGVVTTTQPSFSTPLVTSAFAAPTQNTAPTVGAQQVQVANLNTRTIESTISNQITGQSGLSGKWCDKTGVMRLNIRDKWFEMHRLSGQTVAATFSGHEGGAMSYRDKQLVSTFSGKIGLAIDGGLQWEDKVSPGFSTVHRLEPCEPTETLVTQNFN